MVRTHYFLALERVREDSEFVFQRRHGIGKVFIEVVAFVDFLFLDQGLAKAAMTLLFLSRGEGKPAESGRDATW